MSAISTIRFGSVLALVSAGLLASAESASPDEPTTTTAPPTVGAGAGQTWLGPSGQAPSTSNGGGLTAFLIVALVIALLALVVAVLLLLRSHRNRADRQYVPSSAYVSSMPRPQESHSATAPSAILRADPSGQLTAERDVLASALIQLGDSVRDDPARLTEVQNGLLRAGYTVVDPTGDRFDSRRCEALQSRPTNDPNMDMIVAATARFGYRRNDRIVRQPAVVVYRYQQAGGTRS
jgi:molecular chaperone GrpE